MCKKLGLGARLLLGGLGGFVLGRLGRLVGLLRGLLREQHRVDVRQHAAVRDGDPGEQLPELLVVANRQQHVPRDDPVLLVVPRRVPGELQHLHHQHTIPVNHAGLEGFGRGRDKQWLASAARYSRTAAR